MDFPIAVSGLCYHFSGNGGSMTTRRGLFVGMLAVFSSPIAALSATHAPLEVTYYYMPG
jgi:hypothetical protein